MTSEEIEHVRKWASEIVADNPIGTQTGRAAVYFAQTLLELLPPTIEPVSRQGRLVSVINNTPDEALNDVIRFFPEVRNRLLSAIFRHSLTDTQSDPHAAR